MKKYRLGYQFFGFLGDNKIENGVEISSPDGNSTYSSYIIHELLKRNVEVTCLMPDRDLEGFKKFGKDNFKSFSQEKRWKAYSESNKWNFFDTPDVEMGENPDNFPKLDVLLVEWRFPIPGRNCNKFENGDIGLPSDYQRIKENYQSDLMIQNCLLEYYKSKGTKIIFWDLDYKLTHEDEKKWTPDAIFETASNPKHQYIHRTQVKIPCILEDLSQFPIEDYNDDKELVYIGSRYERDDVIDEYIKPYAEKRPGKVHFYGNWRDYPDKLAEAEKRWPGVVFNKRVTTKDFHDIYKDAVAVPLLAKREYFEHGFEVARIFESVMFGSVPIGFRESDCWYNTCNCTYDTNSLISIVDRLKDNEQRKRDRNVQIERLEQNDVKYFVDEIEKVLNR